MKSAPANLYEFAQCDLPKIFRESAPLVHRRLRGAVRRLWEFKARPPEFADLTEDTFRAFGVWMIGGGRAFITASNVLKHLHAVAVAAAREGHIPAEPPLVEIGEDGQPQLRPAVRCRPSRLVGSKWAIQDLEQLFQVTGAQLGLIGGIPANQWWSTLVLFVLDTGLPLSEVFTYRWGEVDFQEGAITGADYRIKFRSPELAGLLLSLQLHGLPHVFPPPASRNSHGCGIYPRVEKMLADGGLSRMTYRFFDSLRKVGAALEPRVLTMLAGHVPVVPPGTPAAIPPRTLGRRVFRSLGIPFPDDNDPREAQLNKAMTVRQFFESWMLPVVLEEKRQVSVAAKKGYLEAIAWWELVLGDNPPLSQVTDGTWNRFAGELEGGSYRRGDSSQERPLRPQTQKKHKKNIRSILNQARARSLCRPLEMTIRTPPSQVKPCFTLEDARQICQWIRAQQEEAQPRPPTWSQKVKRVKLGMPPKEWLAFISLAFYTGLRTGEILGLNWDMLVTRPEGLFLEVPAETIVKTGKRTTKAVHPCLREALEAIGRGKGYDPIIGCATWIKSNLRLLHAKLQARAGIPEERRLTPHAWRRTHATMIGLTGLPEAIKAAQTALDHSDQETTLRSYLGGIVEGTAIGLLPRLW